MAETLDIAGVPIHPLGYEEVFGRVRQWISEGRQGHLATVNPEMVVQANRDPKFMDILRKATLLTADGSGILWAGDYLGHPKARGALSTMGSLIRFPFSAPKRIRERVTGTDLLAKAADLSRTEGWTLYLLGAREGVAHAAAEALSARFPGARFVGDYSGSPREADERDILERINLASPDLLFVAFGSPAQEFWIHRNLSKMPSVRMAVGVGGAFDFHSGKRRRAPRWMQRCGLEWLWRVVLEPRRIARILNAVVVFPWIVFRQPKGR